jgi:hypothetical protein
MSFLMMACVKRELWCSSHYESKVSRKSVEFVEREFSIDIKAGLS